MTMNSIQIAIYDLLQHEPYFANFLLGAKMMYCDVPYPPKEDAPPGRMPATAGVCIREGLPTFIFNINFIPTLTNNQAKNLIKHEVMHLLFQHTDKTIQEKLKAKWANVANIHELANIAQDCIINQYLDEISPGWVSLDGLSKQIDEKLLPFQTSDYYLEKIMNSKKVQNASRGVGADEHMEDDGTPSEIARAAVDRLSKQAMQKSAGNLPQNLLKVIGSLPEPKLNWKTLLRNFVARNVIRETKPTYKKLNRRFDLPVPGKKNKKSMTLGVCVDSSGSVSNESFAMFLSEVQAISKQVPKVYLIDADCEVQNVTLITSKKKVETKRSGYGGTAYQPAITKALELGCDAIVYFGDMDSADVPNDPKRPFLWVVVGGQNPPAKFGKTVRL